MYASAARPRECRCLPRNTFVDSELQQYDRRQAIYLNDERPLWESSVIPVGTTWKQLRIGELKTLLALVVGDEEAMREGCDRIHHSNDLAPVRSVVYRCIESMLNVEANYRRSVVRRRWGTAG